MSDKSNKFRAILTVVVFLAVASVLLNRTATIPASASLVTDSVIVELRDDPAAVYKAKIEKAGGSVSDEALQAYRDQLRIAQDQFLSELTSRGVSFQIEGVDVKDYSGAKAARADFRFTLVLNGITLKVPAAASLPRPAQSA